MPPHDREQLDARVFAVECWYTSGKVMYDAIQHFESGWNEQHERKISDVRSFIRNNVEKIEQHHGVGDLGGQGRHVSMPDGVVKQIGAIIAKGHTEDCSFQFDGEEIAYIEGLRFTSLSQAIRESTEIQQLLGRYLRRADEEACVKHLLRRLHEVMPRLVYQHLPMKRPLSDVDKKARVRYSDGLLEALEADPNYLDDVYWGDEVSIWLNKHECGKLMCWFEKHDVHGMPPADNMLCDREGSVRLDVLLVVNARRGLVWVEFLTGTKDLEQDGRHNAQMRECMRLRELSYKGVKGSENFKLGCYKVGAA
jgi:hypothetical protein